MFLSGLFKKRSKNAEIEAENTKIVAVPAAAAKTELSDDELIAVITAALQASFTFDSQSKLVIQSIKRTGSTSPIWNRTGRTDRISKKL